MKDFSQFWRSFEEAWNAHDANAVAGHFEEEGVLLFLDGREFQGRRAITGFYMDTFSSMPGTWAHHTRIEHESGSNSSGWIQVMDAERQAQMVEARYALELSPKGHIRRLNLCRTE